MNDVSKTKVLKDLIILEKFRTNFESGNKDYKYLDGNDVKSFLNKLIRKYNLDSSLKPIGQDNDSKGYIEHVFDTVYNDLDRIIGEMEADNLEKIVCASADFSGSKKAVEIANNNDKIYAMIGLHPENAFEYNDEVEKFLIKESSKLMIFLFTLYIILIMLLWKLSRKEYYGENY